MLLYVAKTTMHRFSCEGIDQLENDKSYLFVSNHRDITLDAAMLNMLLIRHNLPACEISFGDNLIANPLIADLTRINRMFPIARGGSRREFYEASMHVSQYIRYALNEKHRSVWIAQRNGRTKDGNDHTEPGLIKMLTMAGPSDFMSSIDELNIVPIAVSYEFEPCAKRKVLELQTTLRDGHYQKAPNEDVESVLEGLLQPKGDVHFCFCKPISHEEIASCMTATGTSDIPENKTTSGIKNAPYLALAELLDHRIHEGYKLHSTNLEAYNVLKYQGQMMCNSDTSYINFDEVTDDLLLHLYAKPVENEKSHTETPTSSEK